MEFYFVRHGQSTNNLLYELLVSHSRTQYYEHARTSDPPLTEQGLTQAKDLAKLLRPSPKSKVLTSPMYRALQTAQPITQALEVPMEVWVDLHEHGGMYEVDGKDTFVGVGGMTKEQILQKFPNTHLPEPFKSPCGGWYVSPTAESTNHALSRADTIVQRLIDFARSPLNKDIKYVWIITHGTFLSMILPKLLKMGSSNIVIHHNNVGVSGLVIRPDGSLSVKFLNRIINSASNLGGEQNYDVPPALDLDHPADYMSYGTTRNTLKSKL
eukprot:TRINITY_DN3055_c0_g1_i4.p1 TRINITY_DN3055_c0_g1~~TRINITY_DN3055_c0_g1_i4.p1  ORF type:complete len:269 (+),score=50.86 TRINITY_DN3055_c0_g1_i4:784-1590(+)